MVCLNQGVCFNGDFPIVCSLFRAGTLVVEVAGVLGFEANDFAVRAQLENLCDELFAPVHHVGLIGEVAHEHEVRAEES